jgi:hypothetical protein
MAKQDMSGDISGPNEDGPYTYDDIVTFTSSTQGVRGSNYPMVAVYLYQDVNADGVVDETLFGPDLIYVTLDHPDAKFGLKAETTPPMDMSKPAKGMAVLYAYGWKAKQESIVRLDDVEFDVQPA